MSSKKFPSCQWIAVFSAGVLPNSVVLTEVRFGKKRRVPDPFCEKQPLKNAFQWHSLGKDTGQGEKIDCGAIFEGVIFTVSLF
jgi:hypothetical protein